MINNPSNYTHKRIKCVSRISVGKSIISSFHCFFLPSKLIKHSTQMGPLWTVCSNSGACTLMCTNKVFNYQSLPPGLFQIKSKRWKNDWDGGRGGKGRGTRLTADGCMLTKSIPHLCPPPQDPSLPRKFHCFPFKTKQPYQILQSTAATSAYCQCN